MMAILERKLGGRLHANFAAFTLVETVVATAVLALVAGSAISAMLAIQHSALAARNRVIAMNLIASRAEDIGTWTDASMQTLVNAGGGTATLVETNASSVVTDPVFKTGFQNRTSLITSTQNFYRVTVSINWNERSMGSDRSMLETASTYVLPTQ